MPFKFFATLIVTAVLLNACSSNNQQLQDKSPYQIFDKNGKKTSYRALLNTAAASDLLLFGERHDNAIIHWLQLAVTKDLAQSNTLILGLEMIERDNQSALDQYLRGEIDQKAFNESARLWPNYTTDYKPLVDFAKTRQLPVIATNIPRRYASMVYKEDFAALDTLTNEEKAWIAPLPVKYDASLSQYQRMLKEQTHGGALLPKAQAIKDATMAYSILENLQPGTLFIHYHGTYHSDFYEGIYWYLKQDKPDLKIVTISAVRQSDLSRLEPEHIGKADFIIVVD